MGDIIGIFYKKGLSKIWSTAVFSRKWSVHGEVSMEFSISFFGFRGKHLQEDNPTWQWTIPRLCAAISDGVCFRLVWKSKKIKNLRSTLRFFLRIQLNSIKINHQVEMTCYFSDIVSLCFTNSVSTWHILSTYGAGSMIFMASFPSNTARPGQPSYMYSACHPLEGIVAVNCC